jgi:capsular exopolysaccharide synthesis family protein
VGQHLRVLLRRKWQFLVCVGLIFGSSLAVISLLPSRYASEAAVRFTDADARAAQEALLLRQTVGRVVATTSDPATEPQVLQEAARILADAGRPNITGRQIAELTRAEVDSGSKMLRVCAEAADATLAAAVANALADAFVQVSNRRHGEAINEIITIQRTVASEQAGPIAAAEAEIRQFETDKGLPGTGDPLEKTNLQIQRLRNRQGEVDNERLSLEAERQALLAMAAGQLTDASVDSLGNDEEIIRLRRAVSDLQQSRSELSLAYKPGHPQMTLIEMRIEQARRDLVAQQQRVIGARQVAIDQSKASLEKQKVELAQLEAKAVEERSKIGANLAQRNAMKAGLEDLKHRHQRRVEQSDDAAYAALTTPPAVKVAAKAQVQAEPIWPPRLWYAVVAAAFAVLFGLVLVFSLEHIDRSIRSAAQAEAVLGKAVVGMVPAMTGRDARNFASRCRTVHAASCSLGAESYRLLRSSLQFGLSDRPMRSIAVTSALPGEGKTTTACNLALSLAATGKRVCLIEADMRRPRLCHAFDAPDAPGLSDVLTGRCDKDAALRASGTENLDLIVGGAVPSTPAELLEGPRFKDLLAELTAAYDHVVLDCPPVLAVTDAQVVAARSDQTLLVVEAGRYSRSSSLRALQWLDRVHAHVAGVVLNNVSTEDAGYEPQRAAYRRYVTA